MNDPTNSKCRFSTIKGSNNHRRYLQQDESKGIEKTNVTYNTDVDIPTHGSYGGLLFDPRWRSRREEILTRDNHSCVICNSKTSLQVHHRQYHFVLRNNQFRLPWEYEDRLLVTLCESCHKRGHNKYKVPTINL